MGKAVLKIDDKYIHWSSISDSPCSPLLPAPLFKQYWDAEYGLSGGFDYLIAMRDVERNNGISARGHTVNQVIESNRAGKNGKRLTKKQIIEGYTITDKAEFEEWLTARKAAVEADNAKWEHEFNRKS